mgnify:CR=1 FL=1
MRFISSLLWKCITCRFLQSLQCNWAKIPVSGAVIRETADTYTGVRPVCTIQPPAYGCPVSKASLRIILSQAIEGEEAAVKKYMNQTAWIKDVNVCDNLRRIAADEQMHVDIFTRLYHSI